MNLQHKLDYAIRDKDGKCYGEGYLVAKSKSVYDRYMSNEGWERYLAEMSEDHRIQYEKGDGGELNEKRGRWGTYPPKMACYGSSSRIIYTLLRGVANIEFEKKFATQVGHTANLDAYLQTGDTDIFLEAKCREIYASHTKIDIGDVYKPVYEYIKQCNKKFGYSDELSKANNKFRCSFSYDGEQIIRFDIKQLISHFLGIAAGVLEGVIKDNIRFVYFIYNPNELGNETLKEVYKDTIDEINRIGVIELFKLFKAVFEYQKKNLEIEKEMPIFEFVLVDQNDIIDKLK